MLRSKLVRILLAVILVVGIASIVASIRSRTEQRAPAPQPSDLLPREISRHSTGFEFSQLKDGRVVFKVFAKTSTMTEDGEHQLEEVRVVGLDEQGASTDRVEARGALYRINEKKIEFHEDVRILLADGTEIFADRASADLGSETVTIRDAFQFTQGDFQGAGQGLYYRLESRLLDARRGLDLSFQVGDTPAEVHAGFARYDLLNGRVALRQGVHMQSGDRLLESEAVAIGLSAERHVETLSAVGSARLRLTQQQTLVGQRISIRFPEVGSKEGHLVSTAGTEDAAQDRARFIEDGPSGRRTIEGERIFVPFHLAGDGAQDRIEWESLTTSGDVRVLAGSAAFDEATSERGRAEFDAQGGELTRVLLTGRVRLEGGLRELGSAPAERQTLTSQRLDVRMAGEGRLESMVAGGPVEWISTGGPVERRLRARDRLNAQYSDGLLHRVVADGACELATREGDESTVLTASQMQFDLKAGRPDRAVATEEVRLEGARAGSTYHSTGDSLILEYADGRAKEAVLQGDFRLDQQSEKGNRLQLHGDVGRYDLASGVLRVEAKERPTLRLSSESGRMRTSARLIHLNRVQEKILAEGEVETTFEAGDRPSVVTAGRMDASLVSGMMDFSGGRPRLVQGSNLVAAERLQIDSGPGNLRAQGDVDSTWVDESGESPRKFHVRAQQLVLDSKEHHAVYEESVHLDSEELLLNAPRLELFFLAPPESGLDRLEAVGGVEIVERGRHWRAERATYLRKTDQVVATK